MIGPSETCVVVDAVGIRGHGGAEVLLGLLETLPQAAPTWKWQVYLLDRSQREFDTPKLCDTVTLHDVALEGGWSGRWRWLHRELPRRVRQLEADLLLGVANVGVRRPVCPQVLLVHQMNAFQVTPWTCPRGLDRLKMHLLRTAILRGALGSRAVIVQTEAMRTHLIEFCPLLESRVVVIPSGYRRPDVCEVTRDALETVFEHSEGPRLFYVAHAARHKNHVTLVRAMPHILRAYPTASLYLTLDVDVPSSAGYAEAVAEVREVVSALELENRVWLLGRLSRAEVDWVLKRADLMVFPSRSESFGLGLVEAMAAGCPVVAADLPYAREVAGTAAEFFDPTDPQDLARVVCRVLREPKRRQELRALGHRRMRRYDRQAVARQILDVLQAAMQTRRAPTAVHWTAI